MDMELEKLITDSEWEQVYLTNQRRHLAYKDVTPTLRLEVWFPLGQGVKEWQWGVCWRHNTAERLESGRNVLVERAFEEVLTAWDGIVAEAQKAALEEAERKKWEDATGKILFDQLETAVARFNGVQHHHRG